ncbi:hypothetical protein CANCADRAFT_3315 [Tortispora caseinolytica NRRL Y-17796]|uniref:Helicase C-terminal domain-containing protein n=1 Tax=Tortispora caseinolytica NRRL Y-17796 TaxID=767744 RepID=A0A1E4TAI6_9ASCO|nr:hypothetical protein CANCADRAFT_3315 [Tortispora caseinolytica NRRL Y-17796]
MRVTSIAPMRPALSMMMRPSMASSFRTTMPKFSAEGGKKSGFNVPVEIYPLFAACIAAIASGTYFTYKKFATEEFRLSKSYDPSKNSETWKQQLPEKDVGVCLLMHVIPIAVIALSVGAFVDTSGLQTADWTPLDASLLNAHPLKALIQLQCAYATAKPAADLHHIFVRVYAPVAASTAAADNPPNKVLVQYWQHIYAIALPDECWNNPLPAVVADAARTPHPLSLVDLYNGLPSSRPLNVTNPYAQYLIDQIGDSIAGVRTSLYIYQRESVARMIELEMDQDRVRSPLLERFRGPLGKVYYRNRANWHLVFEQPPTVASPRGGILAEDMGLGKTLICLTLVVLTKNHWSRLPANATLNTPVVAPTPRIPKLSSLLKHMVLVNGLPWETYKDELPPRVVADLAATDRSFSEVLPPARSARLNVERERQRKAGMLQEPTLILSKTTLIVCPDALVKQWLKEIDKHLESGVLSIFTFTRSSQCTVSAQTLCNFDVVIMPLSVFASEYEPTVSAPNVLLWGKPSIDSLLMHIRWKRIIVDEGQNMGSSTSRASHLADQLSVDCRWVVTGTPARGLVNTEIITGSSTHTANLEKQDLRHLGHIVRIFLKMEPWTSTKNMWTDYITRPIASERKAPVNDTHGMHWTILNNVLHQIIVRHQPKDALAQVCLPELFTKTVFLEASYHNRLSLNLFAAALATNAVTSERSDQDYMFHPSNRGRLRRLVNNLLRVTFSWSGFTLDEVRQMVNVARQVKDKHRDKYSANDLELLDKAVQAGEAAISDPEWLAFVSLHEIGFYITGVPRNLKDILEVSDPLDDGTRVYGGNQLVTLQRSAEKLLSEGNDAVDLDDIFTLNQTVYDKVREDHARMEQQSRKRSKNTEKLHEKEVGVPDHLFQLTKPFDEQHKNSDMTNTETLEKLQNITLLGTSSGRMSYLISGILQHMSEEKILVFYQDNGAMHHISEALEIVRVEHFIYTADIPLDVRTQCLIQFNTEEMPRVLLMDVRMAARGLHLAAASRIYFITPVWLPDVEAQAVKRAHRIGQKREVHVETLVMKGTLENAIVERRMVLHKEGADTAKDMVADEVIRHYIQNLGFFSADRLSRVETLESYGQTEPVRVLMPARHSISNSLLPNSSATHADPTVKRPLEREDTAPKRVRFAA